MTKITKKIKQRHVNRFPKTVSLSKESIKFIEKIVKNGVPEQKFGFSNAGHAIDYLIQFYTKNGGKVNVKTS